MILPSLVMSSWDYLWENKSISDVPGRALHWQWRGRILSHSYCEYFVILNMSLNFPGLFYFSCYLVLVESRSHYNTVASPLKFCLSSKHYQVSLDCRDRKICPKSTFFEQGELLETKIAIEYGWRGDMSRDLWMVVEGKFKIWFQQVALDK